MSEGPRGLGRRGRRFRDFVPTLVFAFCLASSADVRAQTPGAPFDQNAVFKKGTAYFEAGDYVMAIGVWEGLLQSLAEEKRWKVLYNLGLAYQAIGDATLAVERFEAFIQYLGENGTEQPAELTERRSDAISRLEVIRKTHGAVHINASSQGLVLVRIGFGAPRPCGFTAYLLPGTYTVEIGPGTSTVRQLRVNVQAETRMEVDPTPVLPAPQPKEMSRAPSPELRSAKPTERPGDESRFPVTWVLIGASATALSFAVPFVLAQQAKSKREEATALGAGHSGYRALYGEYETARDRYSWSYALPAVLGAATLGIVGYHVMRAERAPSTVRVGAMPSAEGGVLWASGRF